MNYKNILIRADSSSELGIGHVMRCLVLATQYKNSNITFATRNLKGNINFKINAAGYKNITLLTDNIQELNQIIKNKRIDMMVIDHYGIDYEFEKQLKTLNPQLKITIIDDTYEKHYCDILLNHNIYADKKAYINKVPQFCSLRCGSEYVLLRDEFKTDLNVEKKYDVFVAMGGSDPKNLTLQILKHLQSYDLKAVIVTTKANLHLMQLKEIIRFNKNIELFVDTLEVARLMSASLFTIVSASSLLNEIYYLKLPFIAIKTADNQKYMYEFLKKNGFDAMDGYNEDKLKYLIQKKIKMYT